MAHELLVQPEFEFYLPDDLMRETHEAKLSWGREIQTRFNKQNVACAKCSSENFTVRTKVEEHGLKQIVECIPCTEKRRRAYHEAPLEVQEAREQITERVQNILTPLIQDALEQTPIREGAYLAVHHNLFELNRSFKDIGEQVLLKFLTSQNLSCVDCGASGGNIRRISLPAENGTIRINFLCIVCRTQARMEEARLRRNKRSRLRRKLNGLISKALISHNTVED